MAKRSPVISLTRCDEDIDILSELLEIESSFDEDGFLSDDVMMPPVKSSSRNPMLNENVSSNAVVTESEPVGTIDTSDSSRCTTPNDSGENTVCQAPEKEASSSASIVVVVPKSGPCMSRNAVVARENRKRRKDYLENLETETKSLKEENSQLKFKAENQEREIDKLTERVVYLENVLVNQSTLSALLKNIQNTSGVTLKSSFAAKMQDKVKPSRLSGSGKDMENRQNRHKSSLKKSKRKCVFESERLSPDNTVKRSCVESTDDKLQTEDEDAFLLNADNQSDFIAEGSIGLEMNVSHPKDQGGVCLHVSGEEVSLEFCALCCKMARSNSVLDDHSYVRSVDQKVGLTDFNLVEKR